MKYVSYMGYGLLAISIIIIITFLATANFTTQEFPQADLLLYWTYLMIVLASVCAVILPIFNIAKDPKAMIRTLIGLGAMVLVLLVCYLMADATPVVTPAATFDNRFALIASDTGLYATYLAFAVAVIAIVAGEIWKVVKK